MRDRMELLEKRMKITPIKNVQNSKLPFDTRKSKDNLKNKTKFEKILREVENERNS